MRQAARAVIIRDGKLLVIHRNKFGKEYDTLPGGGIEINESAEDALKRELLEETGLRISKCKLVFTEEAGAPYGTQYVFWCDDPGGEAQIDAAAIEAKLNEAGRNLYSPAWIELGELPIKPFVSERLKSAILRAVKDGFPDEPKKL